MNLDPQYWPWVDKHIEALRKLSPEVQQFVLLHPEPPKAYDDAVRSAVIAVACGEIKMSEKYGRIAREMIAAGLVEGES